VINGLELSYNNIVSTIEIVSQIGSAIIGEKGGENNGANIKTNPWKDE
jgi:hypothetical protein